MKPLLALLVTVIIVAGIIALILFLLSGSKGGPAITVADTAAIRASLERLLACSTATADCFVIIKEKTSGKFVQFAGSIEEPLLLVLPPQPLSAEEQVRAEAYFSSRGAAAEPNGDFIDDFGRDVSAASAAATAIFREVYLLPDEAELSITER